MGFPNVTDFPKNYFAQLLPAVQTETATVILFLDIYT